MNTLRGLSPAPRTGRAGAGPGRLRRSRRRAGPMRRDGNTRARMNMERPLRPGRVEKLAQWTWPGMRTHLRLADTSLGRNPGVREACLLTRGRGTMEEGMDWG